MQDDTQSWARKLAPFAHPDNRRGAVELALTLALLGAAMAAMIAVSYRFPFLAIMMAPLSGLFLVRLFIIQHDCGHGALLSSRAANDWIGRALGVLTLTPYDVWKHAHAIHHAGSGNLDKRGHGDIDIKTVAEYRASSRLERLRYRAYRHPLVLFAIGPAYVFLLQHRLPVKYLRGGVQAWLSVMGTNLGIAALMAAIALGFGAPVLLYVYLPTVLVGAVIGVWLFYVQHQFDPTFWERAPQWERERAALQGSSFYDLPQPLMWLTGNIGVHHVHHLAYRIPFHRLPDVLRRYPQFRETGRLTLAQSLRCVRLTLWDEASKRMVTFRQASTTKA
ncbi:MAG TPA: fatty acid desaturase [Rhizobiaceae bacterium]|nr:fatty acid desaturase [Rhizobiaceae bacterium]